MVLLCRKMRWTYDEYMNQPSWFLDLIRMVDNIEISHNNALVRRAENKSKIK